MQYTRNPQGFSLFELLFTLLMIAILVSLAFPSFVEIKRKNALTSHAHSLISSINYARTHSISNQVRVLLCPTNTTNKCGNDWSLGYRIFEDKDFDNEFSTSDRLLSVVPNDSSKIEVSWRAFRSQQFIRFQPTGITWHQNGTFVLCHKKNRDLARGISITKSGRAQLSYDYNGDGTEEFPNSRTVNC